MEVYTELRLICLSSVYTNTMVFAEFRAKVKIIEGKVRMIEVVTKESSMIVQTGLHVAEVFAVVSELKQGDACFNS